MIGSAINSTSRTNLLGIIAALCAAALLATAIAMLPLTLAVLLIVGGIICVITLIRPQAGVLLIVLAIPFGSLRQVSLGVMNVGATEALLVLVLCAWLMRVVARRDYRLVLPPLTAPLMLFLGVLLLSTLGSLSLELSLKELIKWAEVLALYIFVANEMGGGWTKILVLVALGTGALAGLQGIYQFFFQVGPESFLLFDRFMRAHGTFEQPNPYGGYLGLMLPVALGLVVACLLPRGKRLSWFWLLVALPCGALMLAAMVMSWSRGAWLGLGAALAAMALAVVARSGRAAILGAILVLVVAYVLAVGGLAQVPYSITQRFSDFTPYLGTVDVVGVEVTDANFAVLERLAHWQAGLRMWTSSPWAGVGAGNYGAAYALFALPTWTEALGHAHNYYLNIAAEAGLLGLAAYLALVTSALLGAWRATGSSSGWRWGVALGVLGIVVHLSIHHVFDNLFVHGMYLHLAIVLGLIPLLGRSTDRDAHTLSD